MAYEYLPGFTPSMRDSRMLTPTSRMSGRESVLILGTAADGALNVPYPVVSAEQAAAYFGNYTGAQAGATLLPAMYRVIGAGSADIRLMRISGTYASLTLNDDDENPVLKITGLHPGKKYEACKVGVTSTTLTVVDVDGTSHTYTLANYSTLGELAKAINTDNNDVQIDVAGTYKYADEIPTFTEVAVAQNLTNGDDGINLTQAELKTAVESALAEVVDYEVDIVYVPGLYVNYTLADGGGTVDQDAAEVVAEHCYEASQRVGERIAVLETKPLDNPTLANVARLVDTLKKNDNKLSFKHPTEVDEDGNPIDIGKYISVVVGESIYEDPKIGYYSSPMGATYVGLITTLPVKSATTNKVVSGVQKLLYSFSSAQLNDLVGARYVVFRNRVNRGIVVTDGVTAADPNSDYSRLSTVRIVNAAINGVRVVTEPFLGEGGTPQHFNAMHTAVDGVIEAMLQDGALQDAQFKIYASQMDIARGEATIELILVPAFELRKIRVLVSVRAAINRQ